MPFPASNKPEIYFRIAKYNNSEPVNVLVDISD